MKLAVVLFNLGGPDTLEAVEPFLKNLFSDPAIISLPALLRRPLAAFIAKRRAPIAREIYAKLGGSSPIVAETQKQARALEAALSVNGDDVKAFVAMRCWKPFSDDAARAIKAWSPDRIVLLPLYPQFSTTTTQSSLDDWNRAAKGAGLTAPTHRVCCYPWERGFVDTSVALIRETMKKQREGVPYRLLLSAHGLPERTIARGDPYQWQVEKTAEAIVAKLAVPDLDWKVCYQSRVGRLKWIGPATDAEIRRAGADGKGAIVVPIAFVSEHSETLVELDIEYAHLAKTSGVMDYLRVPAAGDHAAFIEGLARLVSAASLSQNPVTCGDGRICPREFARCGYQRD
jgi:ferrochelatase